MTSEAGQNQPTEAEEEWTNKQWADFYYYIGGLNIIPADAIAKSPLKGIFWSDYRDKSIQQESHEHWKRTGAYKNGFGRIMGRVWRGSYQGWHVTGIDKNNRIARIPNKEWVNYLILR